MYSRDCPCLNPPRGLLEPFEVIVERGSDLTLTPFPPIIEAVGVFQVRTKRKNMYRMA